ncbi:MAG TPA: alkaline phosphatase family protein, partial [Opitutaceae bacterium]|nr:alkaline phosphatase family protein [Opitutaceae bacterium]
SGVALRPTKGDVEALFQAVQKIPHGKAYRAADSPAHLHLKPGPRVAPVWVLPDEGWHIVTRATFDRLRTRYAATGYLRGDHGYDPSVRSMHGIFIAHGPAFRRGAEISAVENIHVYNLLCAVLKLKPASNDGDERLVRSVLRP